MVVLEDGEPFRPLHARDELKRLLRLAVAELGPGEQEVVHHAVEIVRPLIGEDLFRRLVFTFADRLHAAHGRGDTLDGRVVFQRVGKLDALGEVAAHQLCDHQALLDVGVRRVELERDLVELDGGGVVLVEIRGAGRQEGAGEGVDAQRIERRLIGRLGSGLVLRIGGGRTGQGTGERDAGSNRHAGKKPKEEEMPHQNAFHRKV